MQLFKIRRKVTASDSNLSQGAVDTVTHLIFTRSSVIPVSRPLGKYIHRINNGLSYVKSTTSLYRLTLHRTGLRKGQIKPKADWRAADSPKKQTNDFFWP